VACLPGERREIGDRGSLPTAVGKKKMVAFHWKGNGNSEIVGRFLLVNREQ
jgi:hypothetical protein